MSDVPIRVRQVDGEWRVWVPTTEKGELDDTGAVVCVGDVLEGRANDRPYRYTAIIGVAGFRMSRIVDSPGIPCEVEGLEEAREALEGARSLASNLLSTCPSYRDQMVDKISKALEGIS